MASNKKDRFFREHYQYAREAGLTDVQARLAVSQAALETGWGEEGVAVTGNNFHGMKVGDDWAGPTVNLPTREETEEGESYTINDDFRQYETPVDSYRDWAAKMETNWPGVMEAETFDEAVAALDDGVKGKYATENSYADRVKSIDGDLVKSGIPSELDQAPAVEDYQIGETTTDAGAPGFAYGDLVAPASVKTSAVTSGGMGFGDLVPNGLIGSTTGSYAPVPGDYRVRLDQVDFTQIPGIEPNFAAKLNDFKEKAVAQGLNLGVDLGGITRTAEEQAAEVAQGDSKTLVSHHMFGTGADISPLDATKANAWASEQWAPQRQLASDLGFGLLGSWDPAHMQVDTNAGRFAQFPRDELGRIQVDPQTALNIRGNVVPTPEQRPLSQEEFAVASAPLPPVAPQQGLFGPAPETVSPLGFAGETVAPSALGAIASMLSPVSSAQAAETVPAEKAAALAAAERVVGTEPFASSFPARPEVVAPASKTATPPAGQVASVNWGPLRDTGVPMGVEGQSAWAANPMTSAAMWAAEQLGLGSPTATPPATQQAPFQSAIGNLPTALQAPNFASPSLTAGGLFGAPASLAQQGALLAGQKSTMNAPPSGVIAATPAISATVAPNAMNPAEWGAFAELQPERVSPVQTATPVSPQVTTETVSPNVPGLGTNGTLFHNPVHALAQPISQPTVSPLQAETVTGTTPAGVPQAIADELSKSAPKGLLSPTLTSPGLLGAPATLGQQGAALAAMQPQAVGTPQKAVAPASGAFPAAPDINKAFPAAPRQPEKKTIAPAMTKAALGFALGGLPGAAVGLAGGLLGDQIGKQGGMFGPGFDGLIGPDERFSVGSGLKGMQAAIGGPRGATATSSSGSTFTSLGPGQGGLRRSDRFGWTEVVGPDGETKGIKYDNPEEKGLLGSISDALGGLFGGGSSNGGFSQAEKDSYGSKAGLW